MNAEGDSKEFDSRMTAWLVEQIQQLCKRAQEAKTPPDDAWFRNLLVGILRSALHDYYSVKVGTEKSEKTGAAKSAYLAAWGCRNLAELRIVTLYVLVSKKNATAFKHELAIDAKEFNEALTEKHRVIHQQMIANMREMSKTESGPLKDHLEVALRLETARGPQTAATEHAAKEFEQLMAEYNLPPKTKPKRVTELAKQIKEFESFHPVSKICSKLLHRTAMSIASSTVVDGLEGVIPFLSESAVNELLAIYVALHKHFAKRGVLPPAK
jgi:hypothetical protein